MEVEEQNVAAKSIGAVLDKRRWVTVILDEDGTMCILGNVNRKLMVDMVFHTVCELTTGPSERLIPQGDS